MNANQKVDLLNEAASLAGDAFEKLASKAPKSMTYDDAITIIVGGMATSIVAQMLANAPTEHHATVKQLAANVFSRSIDQASRVFAEAERIVQ